jgi:hypothetical protein
MTIILWNIDDDDVIDDRVVPSESQQTLTLIWVLWINAPRHDAAIVGRRKKLGLGSLQHDELCDRRLMTTIRR